MAPLKRIVVVACGCICGILGLIKGEIDGLVSENSYLGALRIYQDNFMSMSVPSSNTKYCDKKNYRDKIIYREIVFRKKQLFPEKS